MEAKCAKKKIQISVFMGRSGENISPESVLWLTWLHLIEANSNRNPGLGEVW